MLIGINFFVVFIFEMVVEKINVYIKYNFLVYFNNIVLVFFYGIFMFLILKLNVCCDFKMCLNYSFFIF